MYTDHDRSAGAKLVLVGLNGAGVAIGAWLLFGGLSAVAGSFGITITDADVTRRVLIVACSFLYFLRILGTTYAMLKRTVAYGEAIGVGLWIVAIHVTMASLGAANPGRIGVLAWLGVALYLVGSLLNTGSEYLRKRWKQHPENAGRLYTGGFFRYAVHINYFGDCVLFTGFALVVGSPWALIIPGLMACLFVFVNIPMLDRHLAEHYGQPFVEYSRRTAKFVPFLY